MSHQVLLYYKYADIADPAALMNEQRELCERLGLKGRILIAKEGVNGTVEGTIENTEAYAAALLTNPIFSDVQIKRSVGTGVAFPKLVVKVRSEIVSSHLGDDDVNPTQVTGKYIYAEELYEWIHSDKEFYIIDMRNDFEHDVGHFTGSILPPMGNFRDLPKILPEIAHLKDKTIVTVCTGGVRCEKASGFLVKHGFTDVYQLYGGIVTYMEKYPHEDFRGQLYVFDGRVTMGFRPDDPKREIIGRCEACQTPCETYINCANNECHRHFICCAACVERAGGPIPCPKGCTQPRY